MPPLTLPHDAGVGEGRGVTLAPRRVAQARRGRSMHGRQRRTARQAGHRLGAGGRVAASSRITSPFKSGFSMMNSASRANSSGRPSRFGNCASFRSSSTSGRGTLLTPDGEILSLSAAGLHAALRDGPPPMLVHGPATARRLDLPRFDDAFDLLELFAFCLPARPAAPTPRGLAVALDMEPPRDDAAAAALLPEMATAMLRHLSETRKAPLNRDAAALAGVGA